jgi:hypothetical protein
MVESVSIEDLALDFTIPGYDIELRVSFQCWFLLLSTSYFVVVAAWWERRRGNIRERR